MTAVKDLKDVLNTKDLKLIHSIKELGTATSEKYDHVQTLVRQFNTVLSDLDLTPSDLEEDGLNLIVSRNEAVDGLEANIRKNLDNDDDPDNPSVQDLAFVYREPDQYFYLNGYARLRLVEDDDVIGMVDDLTDYLTLG